MGRQGCARRQLKYIFGVYNIAALTRRYRVVRVANDDVAARIFLTGLLHELLGIGPTLSIIVVYFQFDNDPCRYYRD
jgi:hypothetical protein